MEHMRTGANGKRRFFSASSWGAAQWEIRRDLRHILFLMVSKCCLICVFLR